MSAVGDVTRFGQIDAQADPEYFVHFVDEANAIPGFQELEDLAVAELHVAAGDRVALGRALASPRIGRQLPRLFREAKLADVGCTMHFLTFTPHFLRQLLEGALRSALDNGTLEVSDVHAFWEEVAVAEKDGGPFNAMPFFVVSGTKP